MILEIYKDAFGYALKDGKTILKLGLLSIFSFLIIPFIFLLGYQFRIIKTATEGMINGDEGFPEFNEYSKMFKDGLKVLAVSIVYSLIPVAVFLVLFLLGVIWQINALLVLSFIVLTLLFIITLVYSTVAIVHMVSNEGSLNFAFHISEINEIFKSVGVLKVFASFIGIIIINLVFIVVTYFLSLGIVAMLGFGVAYIYVDIAPAFIWTMSIILDILVALLVIPYLNVFSCRAYGLIYNLR